jgi:hypothetical protein
MEVLEKKSASQRACLWARLLDKDKPPRRWWYPPSSRRDDLPRMSEKSRQAHQEIVEPAHEKLASIMGSATFGHPRQLPHAFAGRKIR